MSSCVERLIKAVQDARAPFTLDVVKSIAHLCNEDPYRLWRIIASSSAKYVGISIQEQGSASTAEKQRTAGPCWRCSACNRVFSDSRQLVNHITFFVRQRDKAHIELYNKIKDNATRSGKTFTQVAEEMLKC